MELLESDNFSKPTSRRHVRESMLNIDTGLQQIEAYRLLLNSSELDRLPQQPLAIGALLDDIAHKLSPYAKQYDTKVEVSVQHRLA
ncbi:MAG TPA: hypothetical protein VFW90_03740, partial [Candidatus Saccharimonadales bacterium]|nr:hypothetical protein [Candidatus Saccharimonadales bacterium]